MLKNLLLVALAVSVATLGSAKESQADNYVRGHLRSSGSYVNPHYRSNADGNFWNNYSTSPNVNPYTGRVGTHHYPSLRTQYGSPSLNYQFDRNGNVDLWGSGIYQQPQRPANMPSWMRW